MKVVVLGAGNVGSHFMEFCEREHLKVTLIDKSTQALEPFKNKRFITTVFKKILTTPNYSISLFLKIPSFFLQSQLLMKPILLLVKLFRNTRYPILFVATNTLN